MFDVDFCYGMDYFQRQETRARLFPSWFHDEVTSNRIQVSQRMYALATFPTVEAKSYRGYMSNGYRFKTQPNRDRPLTTNCGVCVLGDNGADADPANYYGILREVLIINYSGSSVVMFRCDWFDNTRLGVWTNQEAGLVEVNPARELRVDEPFILASQATQVYYAYTPGNSQRTVRNRRGWLSVFTGRARHVIQGLHANALQQPPQHPRPDEVYQDDTSPAVANRSVLDENPPVLSAGVLERVEEENNDGPAEIPTNEQIFHTDDITEFYSSEEDPDIDA